MKCLYRTALVAALNWPALGAQAKPIAPAIEAFALRLAVGDVVPPANAIAWLATPAHRRLTRSHLPPAAIHSLAHRYQKNRVAPGSFCSITCH